MPAPVTLVVGERDSAVPPRVADAAAARLPRARIVSLPGLGHLAHEEAPERVGAVIREAFGAAGAEEAA